MGIIAGIILLSFSASISGSSDAPGEKVAHVLRGMVVDGDTGTPIGGVKIRIGSNPEAAVTGPDGRFAIEFEKPVKTIVSAKKEGYVPASERTEQVQVENRPVEVRFILYRAASIAGRLVDAESRAPLQGFTVAARRFEFRDGRRFQAGGQSTRAGHKGEFRIGDLPPGDYFLKIESGSDQKSNVLLAFSEKQAELIEIGYARTTWPGEPSYSLPLNIAAGTDLEAGDIAISKTSLYRVRVKLSMGSCDAAARVWFQILQSDRAQGTYVGTSRASAEVQCERSALVMGLDPGQYYLEAMGLLNGEPNGYFVETPVPIVNDNASVDLVLHRGFDIEGKVLAPETAPVEAWKDVTVALRGIYGMNDMRVPPVSVSGSGTFKLSGVNERDWLVSIEGYDKSLYVKDVRYNRTSLSGRTMRVDPGSQTQTLEIEFGSDPAVLTGNVKYSGDDFRKMLVGLIPASAPDPFSSVLYAETDSTDSFLFTGLAPGEYSAFAIPLEERNTLNRPHSLENLVRSGDRITLAPKATQSVTLEVRNNASN